MAPPPAFMGSASAAHGLCTRRRGRSGFSQTDPMGRQLAVWPDHRSDSAARSSGRRGGAPAEQRPYPRTIGAGRVSRAMALCRCLGVVPGGERSGTQIRPPRSSRKRGLGHVGGNCRSGQRLGKGLSFETRGRLNRRGHAEPPPYRHLSSFAPSHGAAVCRGSTITGEAHLFGPKPSLENQRGEVAVLTVMTSQPLSSVRCRREVEVEKGAGIGRGQPR